MSSQQAFPVISDAHIIDKKNSLDALYKVFSEELPDLFNVNEISFVHTMINLHVGIIDPTFTRTLYSS